MGVRLQRVNPLSIRESAIDFFWRMKAWPFATREEYERCWDWRYTSIPESDPTVWIALDGPKIVGHVACNMRCFQLDGRAVRAGIPGNFLVDPEYRNSIIGAQLAGAPIKLAQRGETDIFIGYGNQIAHALALGLGCRNLGRLLPYLDVRRFGPAIGRRVPGGAGLGVLADGALSAWRALAGRSRARPPAGLSVRRLSAAELAAIDRSAWSVREGLTWSGESAYLARRFLGCPIRSYRADAVIIEATGRPAAIVISEGVARFNVVLCVADHAALSEVEAVEAVLRSASDAELGLVALLQGTRLTSEFAQAGYLQRSLRQSDTVLQTTTWSALWKPTHDLAGAFAKLEQWNVWYGWNSH